MLAERPQPPRGWQGTEAAWPSTACVHQLFEQQVERTPDAPAVRFGEETLSYRELNFRANALANLLRAQGLGADAVVGICVERSFDIVASVLAVLKAGAAYLPLDPAYPHERLQFMLEDSRAAILLTQTELRHVFPNGNTPALFLDEDWPRGVHPSGENPGNVTTPASLSYLIYTSGSTGKPKGVAMVHRALVNLIDWQLKDSRLTAAAKTLQFTSLSFDVSFQEMFSTLCLGGTLVLIPADLRLNPPELWNFIVREKIARIFLPFVALQQLADAAMAGATADALREVVTAGEQLQITPRLREMFARHPEATLHNHYGPSETHVVTALTLSGDPQEWPAVPSIGRPIQNTQIYLLDENGKPAPPGVPGELCIGGVALARGYFERPDITAERFVRDPFREDAGARLYKTGDLARWLPDGEIEFLGRIDQQVKIRGYRIELGEIEAALNKLPAVRESVVIARERLPGQKELIAYLIANQTGIVDTVQLRQELKQHLPDQMVPSSFVFLETFPLTSSGKVDRKSLPIPGLRIVAAAPAPPSERPWLPIQFQLVQIWEEVLGVKPVGIRDNFFELGGHSLLAVKMMDRVGEITGRQLPVTALFKEATITHLADLILGEEQNALLPMIELQARGARLPFYFLHGDVIGGGFYVRDLSRLLGDNQPFYVLPPVEIPDGALPSVEVMATQHLKDLRAHRPNGPYLLGGFCIGGLIAYEMAQRLSAVGEEVSFVALIDPELPGAFLRGHLRLVRWLTKTRSLAPRQTTRLFSRGHKFLYRLREEWNAPFRDKLRFAAAKVRALFGGNDDDLALSLPAGSVENSDHDEDVLATFQWILSSYVPPRYDGPVTIFVTEEQESFAPFLRRKWQKAAPRAEVHGLAGGHLGSITTNVEVLAGKLDERLKRISASPSQIVGLATLWNVALMA